MPECLGDLVPSFVNETSLHHHTDKKAGYRGGVPKRKERKNWGGEVSIFYYLGFVHSVATFHSFIQLDTF